MAERYRADVQDAGYGDGYAGFAVPLERFQEARKIRCWWDDLGTELPGSPASLAESGPMAVAADGVLRVAVDRKVLGDCRLTGWAIDLAAPLSRPVLALADGDRILAQARACLYRRELCGHGGDGFHGFLFANGRPERGRVLRLVDVARTKTLVEIGD